MQRFLHRYQNRRLHVFVVWEPILPTDWQSPTTGTLARVSDDRVQQFWDPSHTISQTLVETLRDAPDSGPTCCRSNGHFWDNVLVYGPHVRWETHVAPRYWRGPVVDAVPGLLKVLNADPRHGDRAVGISH